MKISQKTPDKLLLSVDWLKTTISEDKEQKETDNAFENSKNLLLAMIGGLTSCLLTLIPSWSNWSIGMRVVVCLMTAAFAVGVLWHIIKMILLKPKRKKIETKDLETNVINQAKTRIRYTALLILAYQSAKTGEVRFMTERKGNYLIHCDMDPQKSVEEQKESIINYLAASYNVQKGQVVEVQPLSKEPFFSIKPIHGEEVQNGFIFYQIKLKKKAKQSLLNHREVSWKSIPDMEAMPELMGRNQDIVMALNENKTRVVDTFEDTYGPLHIIWNITKKCPYDCAICATRDDSRAEISIEKKLQVLNNIFSAKKRIQTLDFAGGDPIYDGGIRTVIIQAINSLGEERVSITTTGRGLQATKNIAEEDITRLLRKCEITIDASHENLTSGKKGSVFSRNSPEYCDHNYHQIKSIAYNLQHLMINIPLIDDDLSDEEINSLITMLAELKQCFSDKFIEAQIIRLMPVGAFGNNAANKENYAKYNPIEVAQKIKSHIETIDIPCRYHCSLRVLQKTGACDKRCNMLDKKIGIDCSGNVFACTWGAYLDVPDNDVTQNPFYLGNLVSSSLESILDKQESTTTAFKRISRDISNQTEKQYCEAVSWYFNGAVGENNDPLSK